MKQLKEWKARFLVWVLSKFGLGYFLILHGVDEETHNGCVLWVSEDTEHLSSILQSSVENVNEVREMVTEVMLEHFKKYEVDCNNFLAELLKKD